MRKREEKTKVIMPDVVGETIEDAEKILKEKNIEITEVKKKFDLFTKKDYVIKTEPEVGENVEDKVVVTISRMKLLPLLLLCVLFVFGGIMFGTGTISRIFTTSAPEIESKTHEWTKSGIVVVTKDAKMIDEVKSYEYCVTKRKTTIGCKWEKTETKNVEITTSGVWNVYFRGIDLKGRKSKVSNRDYVKVDNESPIIEKVKKSVGTNTIKINVEAKDEHSGVNTYYYKINDGEYVLGEKEHTFKGLEANKEYKITIKVVDKVGNETEVEIKIPTKEENKNEENNDDNQNNNGETPEEPTTPEEPSEPEEEIEPPYIDLNEVPGIMDYQEDHKLPSNYDFKNSTGTVTCKVGNDEYTNTKDLPIGNHTIVCTATNKEGMSTTVSKDVRVTSPVTDEEADGWIWLNLHYPAASTKREWKKIDENEELEDDDLNWHDYTGPIRVRIEDIDKIYIRYVLDGNEVIVSPDGYYVDIEPEKTKVKSGDLTKVKINYGTDVTSVEYRINNGVWQEYTEEFEVGANTRIEARIKYLIDVYDDEGNLLLQKTRTKSVAGYIGEIIDPTSTPATCTTCACVDGSWAVHISPSSGYINNGKPVKMTIYYEDGATVKQYKIENGQWQNYTGPITVSWDARVYARAAGYKEINGCTKWVTGETNFNLKNRWYGVEIDPESRSIDSTETTRVTLYTWQKSERISLEYSINGGDFKPYTGAFSVGPNTTIVAKASWRLDNGEILPMQTSTTIYENKNGLRTSVNPNTRYVGGLNKAYVSISTNYKADKIEYTLDNGVTWNDYTGVFAVEPNTNVCGRSSKTNTDGTIQTSPWNCKWISEDDLGLEIYPSAYEAKRNNYVTASIKTRYSVEKIEYTLDNGATWNTYTGSNVAIKAGDEIIARATYKGNVVYKSLKIDILNEIVTLDGPVISETPSSGLVKEAEISITTKETARDVYYRINGGSWQNYTGVFKVTSNVKIESYYVRDSDGKRSQTSRYYVQNIHAGNLPYVRIDTDPKNYLINGTQDKVDVTISGQNYNTLEYSFDGINYQPYTGTIEVTTSSTIYAKGTNNVGSTVTSFTIVTKNPPKVWKTLSVEIVANPDTKDLIDQDGNVKLVNETEVSLVYGSDVTSACYKFGPSITSNMSQGAINQANQTLASTPCTPYTGPFKIKQNETIYAYVQSADGKGNAVKKIDFLTLGIASPIISADTTSIASTTNITIDYAKTADVKKYRIDNGAWIDYTGPFEVTTNCTIEAINEDVLGNQATSTYTVSNIVQVPNYNILNKGDYYLIKLNYPSNAIQNTREYKWKSDGVWKTYDDHGILLIKPSAASKIVTPNGVKITDDAGNEIILTDHYYILDVNIDKVGENLFMKWDTGRIEAPKIIVSEEVETVVSMDAAISYNKALVSKLYRIVYDDGTDTGWIDYNGKFKVEKKGYIYAKGVDVDGRDSDVATLRVDNIDSTGPVIIVQGDMQTPKQKVTLMVSAKDDGKVDALVYAEGSQKASYFKKNGKGLTNPSTITITENGKYTFYAVDNLGNETVQEIEITNIDKTAPDIEIKVLSTTVGTSTEVEIDYDDSITMSYKVGEDGVWKDYTGKFKLSSYDLFDLRNQDGSLTIYAKGKDQAGNESTIKEITYVLDLNQFATPVINTSDGYPMLTSTGMIQGKPSYITYDPNTTDVENYYRIDGGKWLAYTGGINLVSGEIEAKSIRESTGLEFSTTATVVVPTNAIGTDTYDKSLQTSETIAKSANKIFTVSPNIYGKEIKIYTGSNVSSTSTIKLYDKNKTLLNTIETKDVLTIVEVLNDTYYVEINSGSSTLEIREIELRGEREIFEEYTPIISIDEAGWAAEKIATIKYYSDEYQNEYSLDNGATWNMYEGPIKLIEPINVIARTTREGKVLGSSNFIITKVDTFMPEVELNFSNRIQKGYSINLPSYSKIGPSGGSVECKDGDTIITNTNELEIGIHKIVCEARNNAGKISTVEKEIEIIEIENVDAESILSAISDENFPTGKFTITANNETYPVHAMVYDSQNWKENKVFGDAEDVGAEGKYAQNMVIVKINGDLTINEGVTVNPYYTEYGGPKGFTLYVTEKLTNNGTIDNSHGAYAEGQDVYMWKNSDNSYEYVPAVGALGARSVTGTPSGHTTIGHVVGNAGVGRQTGGGGGGWAGAWRSTTLTTAKGGNGTSYSGGSGAGAYMRWNSGYTQPSLASMAGSDVGGPGGNGYVYWDTGYDKIAGGSGNPGGKTSNNSSARGASGTGGLLIIYSYEYENNSIVSANGTNATVSSFGTYRHNSAGSGAGSINIFYMKKSNEGKISVVGGTGNAAGGSGTVTFTNLPSVAVESEITYPNLKESGFEEFQERITLTKIKSIEKIYYSLDGEATWQEYTKPFILKNSQILIYKGKNKKGIETDSITYNPIQNDAIPYNAYDGTTSEKATLEANKDYVFTVSSEIEGRNLRFFLGSEPSEDAIIKVYDKTNKEVLSTTFVDKLTVINIPEGSYKFVVNGGSTELTINEINLREEKEIINEIPVIETNDTAWSVNKIIDITYPEGYENEYSLDLGETWIKYEEPITIEKETIIFARTKKDGKVVTTNSYMINKVDAEEPTIELELENEYEYGTDVSIPTKYTVGKSLGTPICKTNDKEITNIKDLEKGTYEITCSITNGAKVTKEVSKEVIIKHTYTESILNGTDPVLTSGLVPVTIADDGIVTYADTSEKWYSYQDKIWANAVILKDETVTYNVGSVIPEDNIESYFVWIPRYKYKIFNDGNYSELTSIENKVQTIEVEFENKKTDASSGSTVGEWLTHPAFTSFDSNGMWVGKFETGYDGATSTTGAEVNKVSTNKIIIKPNVYSWRSINVGNAFKNAYDYKRNYDSHMMKNTEWGAAAYLSHSKYGINGEIRLNNNSAFITGYAGTDNPTIGNNSLKSVEGNRIESTEPVIDGTYTVNYLNSNSVVASTTGNRSGIYDMSGGAWEYVMGYTTEANVIGGASEITSLYSNFFNDSNYIKYWDRYTAITNIQFNKKIFGDAIGEIGPFGTSKDPDGTSRNKSSWYENYAYFVDSSAPWLGRSGDFSSGIESGIYAFHNDAGQARTHISYRIVLTP